MPRDGIKNKKGMTFIEAIVAMFIFVLVVLSVTMAFGGSMTGLRKAKRLQKNIQEADYMLNLMAKTLRTSSVVESGHNFVQFWDYSEQVCKRFESDDVLKRTTVKSVAISTTPDNRLSECETTDLTSGGQTLSETEGQVRFQAVETARNFDPTDDRQGRVTIRIRMCSNAGCLGANNEETVLQSTVSLRDYGESKIY